MCFLLSFSVIWRWDYYDYISPTDIPRERFAPQETAPLAPFHLQDSQECTLSNVPVLYRDGIVFRFSLVLAPISVTAAETSDSALLPPCISMPVWDTLHSPAYRKSDATLPRIVAYDDWNSDSSGTVFPKQPYHLSAFLSICSTYLYNVKYLLLVAWPFAHYKVSGLTYLRERLFSYPVFL